MAQDEIFFELGLGTRLRRLMEHMSADGDRFYHDHAPDFKVSYFYVFHALNQRQDLTINDIAKLTGFSHSAVSQTVKKLHKEGYIRFEKREDARNKYLSLTAQGAGLVKQITPLWQVIDQTIKQACKESGTDIIAALTAMEQVFTRKSLYQRLSDAFHAGQKAPLPVNSHGVKIIDYHPMYAQDFTDINLEWLRTFFTPEPIDIEVLSDPQKYVIDKGGEIYFAQLPDGRIAGAVALKPEGDGIYELSKMGVRPFAQGKGAGSLLVEHVINRFQQLGGNSLYLVSNDRLRSAIHIYSKHGFQHAPFTCRSDFERANVKMVWHKNPSAVYVHPAEGEGEINIVKNFFTDYANWLEGETGLSLDFQGFHQEMETFPSKYRCLLIAWQDRTPIGAVALLHHNAQECEMKRLWVKPEAQKSGAGRALSIALMNRAVNYGYDVMLLDSLRRLKPAVSLYTSLGFTECAPYNENPEDDVIYMKRSLL